jgi:hypothetical protein
MALRMAEPAGIWAGSSRELMRVSLSGLVARSF